MRYKEKVPPSIGRVLLDALGEDLRDLTESWGGLPPLSCALLFGGALGGGVECADLSETLDVSFLLHDSPIGVDRCGEKWAVVASPLSLVLASEPRSEGSGDADIRPDPTLGGDERRGADDSLFFKDAPNDLADFEDLREDFSAPLSTLI